MKKISITFISVILAGVCFISPLSMTYAGGGEAGKPFKFTIDTESFKIGVESDGVSANASEPFKNRKVLDLLKSENACSWNYPDESISVELKKEKDYLRVSIRSGKVGKFAWPNVAADNYTLPLWEGKYIPAGDKFWKEFLKDKSITVAEDFSMQFFALNKEKFAIIYIIENMFNNQIKFDAKENIKFSFRHEFTSTNIEKEYSFRIYVTANDPASIANIYKSYVFEKGKLVTLEDKAKTNENIRKLYGAPHIYLWDREFIVADNIDWKKFRLALSSKEMEKISEFIKIKVEGGAETALEWNNIKKQDFVSDYQKNSTVYALNHAMLEKDFYNGEYFKNIDSEAVKIAGTGLNNLNLMQLYDLNKRVLKSVLKDAIEPIEKWGNGNSLELLDTINKAGIKNAWLGFGTDWLPGLINPEFVKKACQYGYLIGAYDSYHSIHKNLDPEWISAYFDDADLFEKATVTNVKGEKIPGFSGKGRQFNPTLSLPAVKARMEGILKTGVQYNSWFIDCDAYGEFFDDYTPEHITTQAQDMAGRLKRMEYIRDEKKMVTGSELGNDYAAATIAFAHGLETPVIGYGDADMKKNKESKYFLGGYWSPEAGISPIYSKQVPLKELYRHIYIDPAYSLPLYKLVYNDCVITTHHWEFSSLKFSGEVENRMLYEFLYNVPPLYHLDRKAWKKNRDIIAGHVSIWSPFHKKAVTKEMTEFEILSKDRLVQSTRFGSDLKVVANFSKTDFKYRDDVIKPCSLIIYDKEAKTIYTPR